MKSFKSKNILITGGAGYVGAVLVKELLKRECSITVLDLMIYGENVLPSDKKLKIIKGDIRDNNLLKKIIPGHTDVIHLACISNDPSFELNPSLGKSINLDSFDPLVNIAKNSGINNFIYASSSSVYGVKNEANVTEDMFLEPLTDYSLFKAKCEKILFDYQSNDFVCTVIRPATVCGYSPRQRLDVVVNILTNHAFHNRKIKVFGGDQLRPNIHIMDMVNCYIQILETPDNIKAGKIFNAGYENQTVNQLANSVREVVGKDIEIIREETDDNRSYHISSEKIKKEIGFETQFTVKNAIEDLVEAFENKMLINSFENENYFNIKKMQNLNLK
tara:strand:+ start:2270 stop:3265 length:996 start_codon:yes stop_codon:yes gene_type:complete